MKNRFGNKKNKRKRGLDEFLFRPFIGRSPLHYEVGVLPQKAKYEFAGC